MNYEHTSLDGYFIYYYDDYLIDESDLELIVNYRPQYKKNSIRGVNSKSKYFHKGKRIMIRSPTC